MNNSSRKFLFIGLLFIIGVFVSAQTFAFSGRLFYEPGNQSYPSTRKLQANSSTSSFSFNGAASVLDNLSMGAGTSYRWMKSKTSPYGNTFVWAMANDANLYLGLCTLSSTKDCTASADWALVNWVPRNLNIGSYDNFDIAFEQQSGRILVAYRSGTDDIGYTVWSSSTGWGTETVTAQGLGAIREVRLVSRPNSDQIALIYSAATSEQMGFWMWRNSGFTNIDNGVKCNALPSLNSYAFDGAWLSDGARLLIVCGVNGADPLGFTYTTSTTASGTFTISPLSPSLAPDISHISLTPNPYDSNRISFAAMPDGAFAADVYGGIWVWNRTTNTSTWSGLERLSVTGRAADGTSYRPVDSAWLNASTTVLIYGHNANDYVTAHKLVEGGAWSNITDSSQLANGRWNAIRAYSNPGNGQILVFTSDNSASSPHLYGFRYNGTSWSDLGVVSISDTLDSHAMNFDFDFLPPVISSLSGQTTQVTTGGYSVTVNGSYFATSTVNVGAATGTLLSQTTSSIAFTAPARSAGTYWVRVVNPYMDKRSTPSSSFAITYVAPPSSLSLNQAYNPANATSSRTITGVGINNLGGCTVMVSSTCATIVSATTTSVTYHTPALAAGTYTVRVFGPYGSSTNGIYTDLSTTYENVPASLAINNSRIPAATSSASTLQRILTGSFISTSTYPLRVINNASGTYVSGVSSSVTLTMPATSTVGAYDVRVYGRNGNDNNGVYTDMTSFVKYVPTIYAVSPSPVSTAGGTSVTVTGLAMATGTSMVKVSSSYATSTGTTSSISFTSPAFASGTVELRVYGTGGNDSNALYASTTFQSVGPPTVSLSDAYALAATTSQRTASGTWIGVTLACPLKVNGTCVTGFSTTTTSVTFTAPSLSAGTYTVRVYGLQGSDANGIYTDLSLIYSSPPSGIAISNNYVPAVATGTERTITGTGLSTSTNPIKVAGSLFGTYVSGSSSSIVVVFPSSTPGIEDVRVYGTGGTDSNSIYTDLTDFVVYAPFIESVSTTSLSTIGGETLTIFGKGMKSGTEGVKIDPSGTANYATTTGDGDISVSFTTPAHAAGVVTLRVYAPGGTDANGIYDQTSLTYVAPVYNQSSYRWFDNQDATTPASAMASAGASTTFTAAGQTVRLRILNHLSIAPSVAGDSFKLQISSSTSGSCSVAYSDVSTSSGEIRFNDNASVSDGSVVVTTSTDPTHSGDTVVPQSYVESNPFYTTSTIAIGRDGLWDFSLINNSARRGTTYCFRIVKSDGTALDTYSVSPLISVFNIIPEVQNVTAAQVASGTVTISYDARDPDTDPEAATPNQILPSFEYWNGSSWETIASSTLGAGDTSLKSINSSTFTTHTATWNPRSQIPGIYNASAKIRVTVNDSEASNNTANAQSATFAVDAKNPTITSLTFDSRNDLIALVGSDDTNVSYILSNSSTFAADGVNASSGLTISVGATSVNANPAWVGTSASSTELVYLKLLDAHSNSSTLTVVAPATLSNLVLADSSNPSASFYAESLSWSSHSDTASNTLAYYEIWRSENNTSSFSLVASTTNAFYQNTGLSASIVYYYKVAIKTTEGNYSNYTDSLGDRPDGQGNSSNAAPSFDTTFDSVNQTGASIIQVATTTDSDWGKIRISYRLRDTDTTSGTSTPSFEYNTGSGWVSITSSTLASGDLDPKTVSSSTYNTYTATWNASSQLPTTYNVNLRVRVSATDGQSSGQAVTSPIALDTTAPTSISTTFLINGASSDAEATSSAALTLQLQSITGTPSGETIYAQFSNDSSTWYGANSNGTLASSSSWGSGFSSASGTLSTLTWPWSLGGSTLYVQIRDAYGNGPATDSNTVTGYNQAPEFQSLTVTQATSGTPTAGGLVTINYSIRDTDTSSVTPSFAYSLNSGSWTTIASSSMNSTSTNAKSVASSSYTDYVATWSATSTVTSTYTTDLRVRVTLNDGQSVNNTASSTATITLDSKAPVISSSTLLINGSASSVESVSSTITLGLQGITGYPTDETIYAQFSDDGSTWYGGNSNGTLASSSSWGSGFSSASGTLNSLSWPLVISGRSRTIYTRVTDAFGNTVQSDTNSVGYNTPPDFNPGYGTNGVSVTQVSSSSDNTWGKVVIQYSIRDTDTSVGSSTPGFVTPSFEYSVGLGWFPITTSTLGASDTANKAVGDSSYTTYTATWHASSQLASVYSTTLQIRVALTDNEPVSGTIQATSSVITLDTKAPVSSVRVDGRSNRVSVIASDDSSVEYVLSNVSSLISDGSNASSGTWISTNATSTNTSSSWTLITSSSLNTVYYAARDTYGNTVSGSASAPIAPASTSVSDVSVAASLNFKELISWTPYVSTSSAPFARYEVYRATDSDPSAFSLLASVTDIAQNYYTDINLTSSTTYYYKVSIVTTNSDYSAYSETVSDQPDGLSGAAAQGPTISNVTAAEVQASWARVTWNTDRVSNSQTEYSVTTSSSPYGLSTTTETLVIAHDMYISGLEPNTSYIYRVKSKDVNNKETTSAGGTFTTGGGPIISGVTTELATDHTASITWNTNEDANSTVIYSTTPQNLRDNVDTLEAGNAAMVGTPFQHRVTLSGLNTQTIYYYYVKSTDSDSNISTEKNSGNYFTFTTTQDVKSPIISSITVAAVTKNSAVVTWQTDEASNSQMTYDTRSASSSGQAHRNTSLLDDNMTTNHAITLTGLSQDTDYYFYVKSIDPAGNLAVSSEQSLTTSDTDAAIVYSTGGGAPTPPANTIIRDSTPPIISNIEVSAITPFSAKVTFDTDEESLGFVSFGETASYGRTLGEASFKRGHSIVITGLRLGTSYHFEVKASDKGGNFTTSLDSTFTTKFAVESVGEIANLDNVEQYQSEIDALIESVTPSLVTPFIGKIEVTELTENSVVIKWTTNTRTYGSVLYVSDKDYDAKKESPYLAEVSDTQPRTTTHQVKLNNLSPGQLYRFKIKSYTLPSVVGWSPERTFVTKSSKIRPDIVRLFNTSFVVTWQTPKKTTSFVEYQNIKTKQIRQSGNDTSVIGHVVNVENLDPDTSYRVRAFGYDENKNLVESETITVTTKKDIVPPVITNLKIDNTFVPGRNDRIQTVISWKTDEPANSLVFYGEGSSVSQKQLPNVASSTDSALNTNHNVIISNFKPGTIYQMQVVSLDGAGNRAASPIRVIITPKQTQSVFDVIVKNFEGTFNFVNQ